MAKFTKEKFLRFLVVLIILLPFVILFSWPSQKLHLIACDVGQGDAILLSKGFTQVLIDGGPNSKVLDCLSSNLPFWDRTIELIIATHADKDHIAGLADVIERYSVKQIVSNSIIVDSNVFKNFRKQASDKGISVYSPQKGENIKIAGMEFKVLWPPKRLGDISIWKQNSKEKVLGKTNTKEGRNDDSIVLYLKYKNFDAILTGDITSKIEKQIIQDYQFKDIEVLKVAHHGSKHSSCSEFLKAINPQIAIISVGKNAWGHPTKEVLERLQSIGAKILRTDKDIIKLKI